MSSTAKTFRSCLLTTQRLKSLRRRLQTESSLWLDSMGRQFLCFHLCLALCLWLMFSFTSILRLRSLRMWIAWFRMIGKWCNTMQSRVQASSLQLSTWAFRIDRSSKGSTSSPWHQHCRNFQSHSSSRGPMMQAQTHHFRRLATRLPA